MLAVQTGLQEGPMVLHDAERRIEKSDPKNPGYRSDLELGGVHGPDLVLGLSNL